MYQVRQQFSYRSQKFNVGDTIPVNTFTKKMIDSLLRLGYIDMEVVKYCLGHTPYSDDAVPIPVYGSWNADKLRYEYEDESEAARRYGASIFDYGPYETLEIALRQCGM